MTTIAELFVALGVKGSEKTVGAIGGIKKGLEDVKSTSLETKAAIIGAMYALERMFAASGQRGTDLTNFNALVGTGTKTLQQYQYAARQASVSNEEVAGTFKSLQGIMTKMLMGEGAPKGIARFAQVIKAQVGDIQALAVEATKGNIGPLFQKLQEYMLKESNKGFRNEVGKGFGLGDNVISAMSRNAFRPEVLNKAPVYGDGEVKSLDKANVAWSNLGNKIEMAFGHFNAKHGNEIVNDISKIVSEVAKLAEALDKLATKLNLFDKVGLVFKGWAGILDTASDVTDTVTEATGDAKTPKAQEKKDLAQKELIGGWLATVAAFMNPALIPALMNGDSEGGPAKAGQQLPKPETKPVWERRLELLKSPAKLPPEEQSPIPHSPAAAAVAPQASGNTTNNTNLNVTQNLNFQHPGTESKAVADSSKKGIQDAFRQITAIGNGG